MDGGDEDNSTPETNLMKKPKILSFRTTKFYNYLYQRRKINFLHIGKNAGNQIKIIGKQINLLSNEYYFVNHPHHITLRHIPEGELYIFSIRSPITRFKSGFYSRKRMGRPKNHAPWSADEELAFGNFEHANDLAEALFQDGLQGTQAAAAMISIGHCCQPQHGWFKRVGHFLKIRPPFTILRQENFELDIQHWLTLMDLHEKISFEQDSVKAHRNDYTNTPSFSKKAILNLQRWYAADFEFYKMCEAWKKYPMGQN